MTDQGSPKTMKAFLRSIAHAIAPDATDALTRYRGRRAGARQEAEAWRPRIADVLACPDNAKLEHHREAGRVRRGVQTMFNGVRVTAGGYYGPNVTRMLRLNRGSHEPQEELVFAEVLRRLAPGGRMVELGAYWGFYSLWFAKEIPNSRVWLVEPDRANLQVGKRNFSINAMSGSFCNAAVGATSAEGDPAQVCVDDFLRRNGIEHLEILHADIQGAEVDMLKGAQASLSAKAIDFIFISTHGEDLHRDCVEALLGHDYEVPVSVRPAQSYSFDGLIVAHPRGTVQSPLPLPSLKPDRNV